MPLLRRLSTPGTTLLVAIVGLGIGGLLFGLVAASDADPTPSLRGSLAPVACPIVPAVERGRARTDAARRKTVPPSAPALDRQVPAEVETATFAVG